MERKRNRGHQKVTWGTQGDEHRNMTSPVRICHNKYHLNALRFLSEGCVMIKNNYVTQHCLRRNAGLIVRWTRPGGDSENIQVWFRWAAASLRQPGAAARPAQTNRWAFSVFINLAPACLPVSWTHVRNINSGAFFSECSSTDRPAGVSSVGRGGGIIQVTFFHLVEKRIQMIPVPNLFYLYAKYIIGTYRSTSLLPRCSISELHFIYMKSCINRECMPKKPLTLGICAHGSMWW